MTCQSCVNAVQSALAPLPGIEDISIGLEDKRVVVTGRTPPSVLCKALKDTGRQVLVRGSGSATGEFRFSLSLSPRSVSFFALAVDGQPWFESVTSIWSWT